MKNKYQVFISSTFTDLVESRQKVRDIILKLYHFPIGMEMFSADDDEQWQVIKDTIDSSDYYIVIIGHKYGSETSEGISYTEKEYDYAKSKEIPVLAFIRDRDIAVKSNERDDDPDKIKKLKNFIEKAKGSKMCDFWTTTDDLSATVSVALHKIFDKKPRPGWIRADNVNFAETTQEIVKLSKENRHLRTENESLKSQLAIKKPIIELNINGESEIKLDYTYKYDYFGSDIGELTDDDIPEEFREYMTEDDINKYNTSLPPKEEIEQYKNSMVLYNKIKDTGTDFSLSITNNGNSKANNVYIDITFPNDLLIMSEYDIEDYERPKELHLPENPIRKAKEKFKEKYAGSIMGSFQKSSLFTSFNLPTLGTIPILSHKRLPLLNSKVSNLNSWVENNELTIRIHSLMHTREVGLDEKYKIIPLKPGSYKLKVGIICEEYEEKEEYLIPAIVSNE